MRLAWRDWRGSILRVVYTSAAPPHSTQQSADSAARSSLAWRCAHVSSVSAPLESGQRGSKHCCVGVLTRNDPAPPRRAPARPPHDTRHRQPQATSAPRLSRLGAARAMARAPNSEHTTQALLLNGRPDPTAIIERNHKIVSHSSPEARCSEYLYLTSPLRRAAARCRPRPSYAPPGFAARQCWSRRHRALPWWGAAPGAQSDTAPARPARRTTSHRA